MQTQYFCYGCSINSTDFPVVKIYVTDYPVVKVHVDELPSAWIWQHKLCATLSENVNISWQPECVLSFYMGWRILVNLDIERTCCVVFSIISFLLSDLYTIICLFTLFAIVLCLLLRHLITPLISTNCI